ncbi:MAG: hypothetical protein ACLFMM_07345 [Methanohalobium sp.]|uniref:hypothetical protein n=1 Tax=Methanohalobium sp. TaxID=2837493 RepID=UPI003979FDEC
MDVEDFLQYLSKVEKKGLVPTSHFLLNHEKRKKHMPALDEIYDLILNTKLVGILKQDEGKFKIFYRNNNKYDLIIIMAVKRTNPDLVINLVTCHIQEIKKRLRKDD